MKRLTLSIVMVLMLSGPVFGLGVRALVDRTHINPGESVGLSVIISDGNGEVDTSSIEDFKVLSRGSGTRINYTNGKMSKEVTYHYALVPQKNGKLRIPPLTVSTDDGDVVTKEILITVAEASTKTDNDQEVFVRSAISAEDPYEGQQIIYTFKVFHAVQITNAQLIQEPQFDGFSAKKIAEDKSYRTVLSGREYGVIERNYVLVPLKSGSLTIEPTLLKCDLVKPGRSRGKSFDSFFDDPFFGRTNLETRTFGTPALRINVKALPPYSFDVPFSGLVGSFEFEAQIDKTQMKVGDSATLSLVIKGSGNVMDAEEPSVPIPDGFKLYKDNPEEDIVLDENGYSGKKIFRVALVPVKTGKMDIGPIELGYFNIHRNRYELYRTPLITLDVSPADEKEKMDTLISPSGDTKPGFKKEQVEFVGRDILPIKEQMDALENRKALSLTEFLLFWMIPVCCFGAVKLFFLVTGKQLDEAAVMEKRCRMALKKAQHKGVSPEDFLGSLHAALVSKILALSGTRGETLTADEVKTILMSKGHDPETVQHAIQLLDRIESVRYGGSKTSEDNTKSLLSEIKAIIRRLS